MDENRKKYSPNLLFLVYIISIIKCHLYLMTTLKKLKGIINIILESMKHNLISYMKNIELFINRWINN